MTELNWIEPDGEKICGLEWLWKWTGPVLTMEESEKL